METQEQRAQTAEDQREARRLQMKAKGVEYRVEQYIGSLTLQNMKGQAAIEELRMEIASLKAQLEAAKGEGLRKENELLKQTVSTLQKELAEARGANREA